MSSNSYTFRLFKRRNSLFSGLSSMFDFSPLAERYVQEKEEKIADLKSIESDWKAIGQDMKTAVKEYESEFSKNK